MLPSKREKDGMIQYPILLDNNELIRDAFEMREYLCSCGFSVTQANDMCSGTDELEELKDEVESARDAYHDNELACDAYSSHLRGLVDEVDSVIDRLRSGKSCRGYTKQDLADILYNAARTYEF